MHKLWPPKFATVSVKSVPGEPRYKGFHDGFISRVHLSRWWMLVDMKESRHPINLRTGELPLESIPQVFQFLHQIWYTWRFLSHPLVHHVYHVLNHVSYVSFVCGQSPGHRNSPCASKSNHPWSQLNRCFIWILTSFDVFFRMVRIALMFNVSKSFVWRI